MKIHFVSIGGSVMHQLAIALQRKGYTVSGTDDEIFEPALCNLRHAGLLPETTGWNPGKIHAGLDAVILGMHAKADNPELARAKELGLPVYSFPEYIYEGSRDKKRVVVGGSHGKTTTTAMIMHVLRSAGQEFDYLVGARLEGFEGSVNITDAPVIICEGDEYPASALQPRPKFHFLHPHLAVLTGIAWDHINVFPTFENYLEQFQIFIQKIEPGGTLIYNASDPVLKSIVEGQHPNDLILEPYALPQHFIENGVTSVVFEGQKTALKVFGAHNLLNMQAAFLVCKSLGVSTQDFVAAIANFTGAARRLEPIFTGANCAAFRDFAHAPSKVKATVEATRAQFPERKLYALLELHTYSSLNEAFMQEFDGALAAADEAAVFYSAHALELKRLPPLPKAAVETGFGGDNLSVLTQKSEVEDWIRLLSGDGVTWLVMSSGVFDGLDVAAVLPRCD